VNIDGIKVCGQTNTATGTVPVTSIGTKDPTAHSGWLPLTLDGHELSSSQQKMQYQKSSSL
jgi:hypothetical protein